LQWQAHTIAGANQIRLTATNTGVAHVQVTRFTLKLSDHRTPSVDDKSPEYVFPGQHKDWQVELKPAPAAGAKVHLSADTDAGAAEADIAVEAP
jgi:P pilus assembly chaperone PapD